MIIIHNNITETITKRKDKNTLVSLLILLFHLALLYFSPTGVSFKSLLDAL